MGSEVIVSLITLIGSALGTFGGIFVNGKLTEYRLKQLEEEQKKHNSVIERTYKLEEESVLQEEKIKSNERRIEILERKLNT